MLTYHILYNPHAGSGRGQEATYRLNVLLPDDRLLFRDITEPSFVPSGTMTGL